MDPGDWEELAQLDAHWTILGDPHERFTKLDNSHFFLSGAVDIAAIMDHAEQLGYPVQHRFALDFGCALGRHTRALATYFSHCEGIDVSKTMVTKAVELNRTVSNCHFLLGKEGSLTFFRDESFDMVYSWGVLQYCSRKSVLTSCIRECLRVLGRGGLLVFQVPDHLPRLLVGGGFAALKRPLKRWGLRRRHLYWGLRSLGLKKEVLYKKLNLWPEPTPGCIPETEVVGIVTNCGATIADIRTGPFAGLPDADRVYWVTKGRSR
jgi:SAM-dependent methyltransferase